MSRTLKEKRAAKRSKSPAKPARRQRKPAKARGADAPPAKASKAVAPPPAAKAPPSVRDAMLAAFERWKSGAQISVIASEVGVKRSKLRRNFIQIAGSKDEFKRLRGDGAGGTVEPFGGKRATGRVVGSIGQQIDDAKVPRITSARASDGWTVRRVWRPTIVTVEIEKSSEKVATRELVATVHIDPDGNEYVSALPSEPADLIYDSTDGGVNPSGVVDRLRRYDESRVGRRIAKDEKHDEKQLARGEIAIERTRERKRKAKAARRGRKHA